jgi:putative chitinase
MSKIQEFIDAWNAKIDTAIVESQSKIDTYLSTRQTAIALTDPFVLKMPDLKVLNIRENTTIPGFDVTTLGQLFEWSYPINGSKNFSTDSTLYIDNYNIVQDYKFDYNITDSNLYTTGYTYGTMSYLADQYINGITSKLSLNLILDINLKGFIYLDSYKRLKDMGGKVWFDNYMHSLYSSIFGLKISVSKLKYSDYEDISSYIDATLVKQYLKGFYSIGSDFDLGSGDQSKYYQAILEAGDHFFTGTQSSTQSSTQSISDYKLSVIDPKSDNDKKIEGLINFSTTGPNISASSTLNGLPNPYTNTLTNLPVENNTGSISWNSNTLFTDKKQLSDNVVLNLQNMIISKYGLNISLKYEDVGVNNPTDTASQSSTNPSILPVTASIPTSGEYTFDVQIIDTFYNPTIGFLTITGKQDTTFIYNDYGDDELSQEYTEERFTGTEEEKIMIAIEELYSPEELAGLPPEEINIMKDNAKKAQKLGKPLKSPPSDLIIAMRKYGITNKLERAHFLAQCGHESGDYIYKEELASGKAYEGRKDLGNTNAGDGKKYKGRGYIQLTGRANYELYSKYLVSKGLDNVLNSPDLVATKYPADAACYWWTHLSRNISQIAQKGSSTSSVESVTRRVNGGTNGLNDRQRRFDMYWQEIQKDTAKYA